LNRYLNGLCFTCIFVLLTTCSTTGKIPKIEGLLSLDEALSSAAMDISDGVQEKTEIAIIGLTSPLSDISDYLIDELSMHLISSGKFIVLERGPALDTVDSEHQFQMTGLVKDDSAVGIGHYLGAKVVLTGTFNRYAGFCQLRLRAIDVRSSQLLVLYTTRIRSDDEVLISIMQPLENLRPPVVREDALVHLNRGKDLYAEVDIDLAINEFEKAISIDKGLAEAYYYLGLIYIYKYNDDNEDVLDRGIAYLSTAIGIEPNFLEALTERGSAYASFKNDLQKAIADFSAVLNILPNSIFALKARGNIYLWNDDYERAIADYTSALRLNPNDIQTLISRGDIYNRIGNYAQAIVDYEAVLLSEPNNNIVRGNIQRIRSYQARMTELDRIIADYTATLRIHPNDVVVLFNRGNAYQNKLEFDLAIADYNEAIRLNPNYVEAYNERGGVYYWFKKNIDRAISDWEAILRIDPNNVDARQKINNARNERGY